MSAKPVSSMKMAHIHDGILYASGGAVGFLVLWIFEISCGLLKAVFL